MASYYSMPVTPAQVPLISSQEMSVKRKATACCTPALPIPKPKRAKSPYLVFKELVKAAEENISVVEIKARWKLVKDLSKAPTSAGSATQKECMCLSVVYCRTTYISTLLCRDRTLLDDFALREQAQKTSHVQKLANSKAMRAWAEQQSQLLLSVLKDTNAATDALCRFSEFGPSHFVQRQTVLQLPTSKSPHYDNNCANSATCNQDREADFFFWDLHKRSIGFQGPDDHHTFSTRFPV